MEPPIPDSDPGEGIYPAWLDQRLVSDFRFARAYNSLGDERRALIKGLVARHYRLQHCGPSQVEQSEAFGIFDRKLVRQPVPFVLILVDALFDAPALMLAALLPALCARVPQVLVARLGKGAPDALLVACELSGQERLATLGPVQLQRLLFELAVGSAPGAVIHPDTEDFRRMLAKPALRQALDASPLRLLPLRAPRLPGLWRDAAADFPPADVALLYGALNFEEQGAAPGQLNQSHADDAAWQYFAAVPRDLLLAPAARAGQSRAALTASGECLGMWRWSKLQHAAFALERQTFLPT